MRKNVNIVCIPPFCWGGRGRGGWGVTFTKKNKTKKFTMVKAKCYPTNKHMFKVIKKIHPSKQ